MKFFKIIYPKKRNTNVVPIFDKNFINKNKNKYKIIYENKLYPLQTVLIIPKYKMEYINIKLMSFINDIDINDIIIASKSFNVFDINKNHKTQNTDKKYSGSRIIYKINRKEYQIKIFGSPFVKNNKDKCLILYKYKTFHLMESFLTYDIDKEDVELEIILIELKDIVNRSFMFADCNNLKEFFLFEGGKINLENNINLDDSFKYNSIYYTKITNSLQKSEKILSSSESISLTKKTGKTYLQSFLTNISK